MISTIEELSLNAWPALQTFLYDGWVIRFANGYTRRANSVNPIYPSGIHLEQKIHFCEELYQNRRLPVIFKITPEVYPQDLDARLAGGGYQKDALTSLQVMDLTELGDPQADGIGVQEELTEQWLDGFCRMSLVSGPNRETLMQMLVQIIPKRCFVSMQLGNQMIACGLGVVQSRWIGLYDIVTDSDYRGRGMGQTVIENILAWGKRNGAQQAYLQVMLNNSSALRLYAKIGFVEKYQYWYRVRYPEDSTRSDALG